MPERLEARISRSGPAGGSRGNHPSGREGPRGPPLASATPARRHRLRVPAAPPSLCCRVRPPLLAAGSKPGSGFVSSQQEVGPSLLNCFGIFQAAPSVPVRCPWPH